jgi:hypothetical protein
MATASGVRSFRCASIGFGGSDPRASFLGTQAAFMGQAAFITGEYLVEMLDINVIGPFS